MSIIFFGDSINFTVDGRKTYPSFIGSFMTLLIAFVILVYGINQFKVFYNREDTSFNSQNVKTQVSDDEYLLQSTTNVYMVVRFTKDGQTLKAQDINGYLAIKAFNAKIYTGESSADFS